MKVICVKVSTRIFWNMLAIFFICVNMIVYLYNPVATQSVMTIVDNDSLILRVIIHLQKFYTIGY
ncbi:hypothetical protein PRVXT_001133 [Proteinivorax tanatarense]|uniref:Uncharacterized protein n=1 Tax=Proteinivorax tanatarense TaxID=1260629 RepID=A0AAU7VPH4_9FIRM